MGLGIVPNRAQKEKETLWGREYTTPESEAQVKAILKALSESQEASLPYFEFGFEIGPCLWARLEKADADLNSYASVISKKRLKDGLGYQLRVLFKAQMKVALKSPAFRALGQTFSAGTYRAGTPEERYVMYQMSGLRAKYPLTVVQVDKAVLAISVRDGKVDSMEMVSDW